MANHKKLIIRASKASSIVITRNALEAECLVYVAVVNKPLKYRHGQSHIAYIGTTQAGAGRIAASAAGRAPELLQLHGVNQLSFFVITCSKRQNVETWKKLETGLILTFKRVFGEPPRCNKQGKNRKWNDELDYFTSSRLEKIIEQYS